MKKYYWLIMVLGFQLAFSFVASASIFTNVNYQTGNEQYTMDTTLPFDSIKIAQTYVAFNNIEFHLTSTNPINITLKYLINSFVGVSEGDTLIRFDADTITGNVIFNLTGFPNGHQYTIEKDGVQLATPSVIGGQITFTNAAWSEHEFTIIERTLPLSSGITGSDFIDQPWNITFSPFTDLFEGFLEGAGVTFFLFPLTIIAIGLYVKTREPVIVSMYLITSGALFATGGIFIGSLNMQLVYVVFAAIGFVSLFISLFFKR